MTDQSAHIVLGHVSRPHGVHGAFIIAAYTDNPELILAGRSLELVSPDGQTRRPATALKGKEAAQGLIVKIKDVTTREAAADLKGWTLVMPRAEMPEPDEDEIYWADLIGLAVETPEGRTLGRVEHLMEAGAGLILVVMDPAEPGREWLLPFQEEFVVSLNKDDGRLVLDPPPGLLEL